MSMTSLLLTDRDVDLPGLALLLDDRLRTRWLADHGHPDALMAGYLRYKPGTSLTVGFDTATGPVFGYAVTAKAAPKLAKLVDRAPTGSILVHDHERRILLAEPIADRDLPGLRSAAAAGACVVAYKPQRRWVGMLADQVLRCYRPSTLSGILRRWPTEHPAGVRIPHVVSSHRRQGMLVVERIPGRPVHRLDDAEKSITGLTEAGRALATWHGGAPSTRVRADLPDLRAAADQLEHLVPDETSRICRIAARLATPRLSNAEQGWCHGDFSADQVLVPDRGSIGPDRTAEPSILDWDRSGHGPLAVDLANAEAAGLFPGRSLRSEQWQAILDGYRQIRPLPSGLDWYRARARFTRAAEPFRTAQPDWPERISATLDDVQEML